MIFVAALLAGCGTGTGGGTTESTAGSPEGFPLTVDNCGVRTTYQHPPQRAVTMNQNPTEIMLALGLEDRMIGTAYADHEILPKYREAYQQVPVLAEEYPSYEKLLAENPDFVYGGMSTAFDEQQGRSRDRLHDTGIDTYLNPGWCEDVPNTMQKLVWDQLRTVGRIFGVPERADDLVGKLRSQVSNVRSALEDVEPRSVFVYDSGTKAPHTAGGDGMANTIIELAGGKNIFADLSAEFGGVSWEQVIKRQPDTILIMDYGDESAAQKKEFLLNKPELANVPAIKHEQFAVLPLNDVFASVRAPRTVVDLAHQLHEEQFQ